MLKMLAIVLLACTGLAGCAAPIIAGMGLGYLIADEVMEGDGVMDPLERLRGKENHDPVAEREHYRVTYGYEYQNLVLQRAQMRREQYEAIRGER